MTTRMLTVSRRQQLTFCSRQLLRGFAILLAVIVASTLSSVNAGSTAVSAVAAAGPFNLIAVLPAVNFSDWTAAFQDAVSMAAAQAGSAVMAPGEVLSAGGGVRTVVNGVCAAVDRRNVSAMIVVGDQNVINTVLVVARHLGVPLLGYNDVDRRSSTSPVRTAASRDNYITSLRCRLVACIQQFVDHIVRQINTSRTKLSLRSTKCVQGSKDLL